MLALFSFLVDYHFPIEQEKVSVLGWWVWFCCWLTLCLALDTLPLWRCQVPRVPQLEWTVCIFTALHFFPFSHIFCVSFFSFSFDVHRSCVVITSRLSLCCFCAAFVSFVNFRKISLVSVSESLGETVRCAIAFTTSITGETTCQWQLKMATSIVC